MKALIGIIQEHIGFRKQIFKLAKADIIRTFKGAALGWAWALIKPGVQIFVFWFAFAVGMRSGKPVDGYPFFIWMVAGLVPWFYVSDMLTFGTNSIRTYHYLVTKMKFPVSTIPTFVSISNLIINLGITVIIIITYVCMGFKIDIYFLQLPIYTLLMFMFFTTMSLLFAPLCAMSKDFGNLVKSMITALFWLSGVIWNADKVSNIWIKRFLNVNPITYICNGYRNCFIYKKWIWEQDRKFLYFAVIFLIMFPLAVHIYKKLRKEIPDVL